MNSVILTAIFIILLVVVFRTVKESLKFNGRASFILSVCISLLATIGLNGNLPQNMGVILLPYKTVGICIIVAILAGFLLKWQKEKRITKSEKPKDNRRYQADELETNRTDDDRMKW